MRELLASLIGFLVMSREKVRLPKQMPRPKPRGVLSPVYVCKAWFENEKGAMVKDSAGLLQGGLPLSTCFLGLLKGQPLPSFPFSSFLECTFGLDIKWG